MSLQLILQTKEVFSYSGDMKLFHPLATWSTILSPSGHHPPIEFSIHLRQEKLERKNESRHDLWPLVAHGIYTETLLITISSWNHAQLPSILQGFFLQALLHGISKLLCVDKIGEPPVPPSEPSVLPQLLGSRQDSGPLHHCTSEPAPMTRTSGAEQHHNISKLLKIGSPLNRIQGSFMIDWRFF